MDELDKKLEESGAYDNFNMDDFDEENDDDLDEKFSDEEEDMGLENLSEEALKLLDEVKKVEDEMEEYGCHDLIDKFEEDEKSLDDKEKESLELC